MRIPVGGFLLAGAMAFAADKVGRGVGDASDKFARVQATLYLDKASIAQAVGGELYDGIIVIEVKVTPAEGQKLNIDRDDFLLRTDKDGQRSTPYTATQVAGSSVLTVKTGYGGGGVANENRGPVWGGLGGGMPRRMPGNGGGVGNSAGQESAVAQVQENTGDVKENPLLASLKEKILPEKETTEPIGGQLYYLMEGKQKVKDIELLYKTPAGRLSVRFKQN